MTPVQVTVLLKGPVVPSSVVKAAFQLQLPSSHQGHGWTGSTNAAAKEEAGRQYRRLLMHRWYSGKYPASDIVVDAH